MERHANATAAAGQSYVSADGVTWTDMTQVVADTDVCLKGYGLASEQPAPDPAPTPEPSASPVPDPTPTSVAPWRPPSG